MSRISELIESTLAEVKSSASRKDLVKDLKGALGVMTKAASASKVDREYDKGTGATLLVRLDKDDFRDILVPAKKAGFDPVNRRMGNEFWWYLHLPKSGWADTKRLDAVRAGQNYLQKLGYLATVDYSWMS